ncbi:TlpA family protein disulfide reductase, partial [Bacillus pumilus]
MNRKYLTAGFLMMTLLLLLIGNEA